MRLASLALAACAASHADPHPAASAAIAIRDVTVIDGKVGAAHDMTVIVRGDKIVAVGPAATTPVPPDARVIDGRDRYLIPGLWDMHVHLVDIDEPAFGVLVAHGITSVRDMGGDVDKLTAWRAKSAAGTIIAPQIRFCGPMLEGTPDAVPAGRTDHWVVADPAAAETTVAKLAAAGVDCIKMRSYANEATYLALAAAARRHGLPLVGHAPWGIDPMVAATAGQASLEHAFYPWPWADLSTDKQHAIADAFRKSGTLVTPTLIAWQSFLFPDATIQAVLDDTKGTTDPRERTVTPRLRRNWRQGVVDIQKRRGAGPPKGNREEWEKALAAAATELRELHDRGVGIMVGTDTGAPLVYPGASVHQEMKLLVHQVGLRPIDAIISATIIPAKHFGLEASLGTIELGKRADLVLLTADPLADIQNIARIETVILGGRLLDRSALTRLLAM